MKKQRPAQIIATVEAATQRATPSTPAPRIMNRAEIAEALRLYPAPWHHNAREASGTAIVGLFDGAGYQVAGFAAAQDMLDVEIVALDLICTAVLVLSQTQ